LWLLRVLPLYQLLAVHIVLLLSGVAATAGVWALSDRLGVTGRLRVAVSAAAIPVLLAFTFDVITPDLPVTALILGYLWLVTSPRLDTSHRHAALIGVVAGLAYLTKAFVLPFFLVHFTAVVAWRMLRNGNRRGGWITRYAVALGWFFLLAVPWIAAISAKYGHLTYSTAPQYNWRLVGPAHLGNQPTYEPGLLAPSGPHSLTAWQDPTLLPVTGWSPVEQPVHLVRLLLGNTISVVGVLGRASLLALPVLAAALWVLLRRRSTWRGTEHENLGTIGLAGALMIGGYLITKVQPPYLWLPVLLIMILGALVAHRRRARQVTAAGTAVLAGLLLMSFALPAAGNLYSRRHAGDADRATAARLTEPVEGHNAASNDVFRESLFISYHRDIRYYGLVPPSTDAARQELEKYDIRYFFYWGNPVDVPPYLRDATPCYEEPARKLRIYRLG
jgi:hypothetical protein